MKKAIALTTSFVLTASLLLASPVVHAAGNQPFYDLETFKKDKQLMSENQVELSGYNEYGDFEEEEPNNTFDTANKAALEDFILGTFSSNDKDFYKVKIDGDSEADFILSLFSANEDTTAMELSTNVYDANYHEVEPYFEDNDEYGYGGGYTLEPGIYYIEAFDGANLNNGEEYVLYPFVYKPEPYIERIAGKGRYHTAANIAVRSTGGYPADHVVLATGTDFPDALAGAPLASMLNAPILLTTKKTLPKITESALSILDTKHITILGGSGVVSKDIENVLETKLGIEVDRIAGTNRYETAAAIAKELPPSDTAIVAYGRNFPDALSIAPVAAMYGMPILLTEKENIPAATSKVLKYYDYTFAVGGPGVIAKSVLNKLPDTERIAGQDRYETSVTVAQYFGMDPQFVSLATGHDFADALTGSVYSFGEPLLLTPKNNLHPEVKVYFKENETFYFQIFGGTGAVGEGVEMDIWSLFE